MGNETTMVGMIDLVIQDIRDKTATRVNFVPPGPPVNPSPEQKEDLPFLNGGTWSTGGTGHARGSPSAPAIVFVPLPITTPVYPNARFFLATREDGGEDPGSGNQAAPGHLVIGVDTENLGQLWLNIAAAGDSLLVKCFAEKEEVSQRIRDNLPELKAALEDLDFSRIELYSLIEPVLEHLERPGTPDADGGSLIDIEV